MFAPDVENAAPAVLILKYTVLISEGQYNGATQQGQFTTIFHARHG